MEKDISSVEKDFKYERADWKVQRVFWGCMSLVLLYGLLGGLGDSGRLLNDRSVEFKGGMFLYQRKLRVEKTSEIKLQLDASVTDATVSLNNDYFDRIKVVQVIPEPQMVSISNNRTTYAFEFSGPGTITFFLDPMRVGRQNIEVDVNGQAISASQYIFF